MTTEPSRELPPFEDAASAWLIDMLMSVNAPLRSTVIDHGNRGYLTALPDGRFVTVYITRPAHSLLRPDGT